MCTRRKVTQGPTRTVGLETPHRPLVHPRGASARAHTESRYASIRPPNAPHDHTNGICPQGNFEVAQNGVDGTQIATVLYTSSGSSTIPFLSPQTLVTWQTFALRINSSNGISIYHNMVSVLDQIDSSLSSYFYDRTVTGCRVAQSWFSGDGYADMQLAGLLVYDMAMTQYEFDTVHSYINSLPVTDPPPASTLLSTAKVRHVSSLPPSDRDSV